MGAAASSTIFDLVEFRLAVRDGKSLDFVVSDRVGLLVLDPSVFDRKLEDDRVDSALIRILVFGFSGFSSGPLSSFPPTVLPLCDCWSTLVNGGLGGAWLLLLLSPLVPSLPPSVRSVGSGVGILGLPTTSLL